MHYNIHSQMETIASNYFNSPTDSRKTNDQLLCNPNLITDADAEFQRKSNILGTILSIIPGPFVPLSLQDRSS